MTDIPAVDIPYDSGARALVRAVQEQMGERSGAMLWGDTTWLDQVVVTWFGLSPADALLPRVLRDDAVWPQGMRDQVVTEVRAILAGRREPHSIGYAHSRIPLTFGPLLNRAHELADQE